MLKIDVFGHIHEVRLIHCIRHVYRCVLVVLFVRNFLCISKFDLSFEFEFEFEFKTIDCAWVKGEIRVWTAYESKS